MEALFASLVSKYGFEIAAEMLGLDKQSQNPKYTFGMPFTNTEISFDPIQSLGRFGLNKIMSGGLSGIMGPAALFGGALMLGRAFNPLNPSARNYSPNLAGQLSYLGGKDNFIGTDPSSGLMKYGPGSVLAGKNVMSLFGSNNYQKALDKQIDYFEKQKQKKGFLTEYQQKRLDDTKKEKKDFFDYRADVRDRAKTRSTRSYSKPTMRDVAGNGGGSGNISGSVSRGGTDDTPGTPFRRGGIASL